MTLKQLILVPTSFELQHANRLQANLTAGLTIELCGFGAVVAAARTAELIARHCPQRVALLGIAGAIHEDLQLGAAYEFSEVVLSGIGVGAGIEHKTASELGWPQWECAPAILDCIELQSPLQRPANRSRQLLTVCAGAAGSDDVKRRRDQFPRAAAEDMEGFAVAVACKLANVSLRIFRGISNRAGDRDKQNWHVAQAMQSVVDLVKLELDL